MSEIRAISDESLAQAVEIVRDGGLIVIPTDTVYGVACDPRNIEAIRKVFAAKQRPKYKALQVLLPSIESLEKLHLDLPVPLNRLSAMFMPGAFSPIAVASDNCTLATVRTDPATGRPHKACAFRILRPHCVFCVRPVRWPPPAPTVPAMKARKPLTRPFRRSVMRWICIWMGERPPAMWLPQWWRPTRMGVTALRFFERE